MTKYRKDYRKTVWGYFEVTAKDEKEAQEKLDNCEEDEEMDNKSDYEMDEHWYEA